MPDITTISNKRKVHHQSTYSDSSAYPIPSLSSSISSYDSLFIQQKAINNHTDDSRHTSPALSQPNSNTSSLELPTSATRKRWDDSQFAIELCDENLLIASPTNPKKSNRHSSGSINIKEKIKHTSTRIFRSNSSSLENEYNKLHFTMTTQSLHTETSSLSSTRSSNKISTKVSSSFRKLKNMISL